MQCIENGHSFRIQPDHLGVDNRGAFYASRVPNNQRITLRPVRAIDGVKPHPTVADMDLQPIPIMLQLMRPTRPGGRLFGDDWLARMNESGWRV